MCWKKQTIWTVCWHTTTESGTCSKQERLVQKNLNSHHPHDQPSPRPLWMILLCCLPSEPPSPSQSRKRCLTETWTEEVERLCPRCQTIRDAPSLVPGRAPAAANSNTRNDAGGSPAKPAAVAKRNGFVGDRNLHPTGTRHGAVFILLRRGPAPRGVLVFAIRSSAAAAEGDPASSRHHWP
ncbi:hypothetical protein CSOJ01_04493 [Colletotrichum sojae]|uniref:Uncharacterized protein n=1 Tax=Colletotrichum sojae TaxID=2175907 RepID=A0A8H6JI48_9PEZI|nr:hypothetical protein CSOJ01_04493 [Colletotrichum sojae]